MPEDYYQKVNRMRFGTEPADIATEMTNRSGRSFSGAHWSHENTPEEAALLAEVRGRPEYKATFDAAFNDAEDAMTASVRESRAGLNMDSLVHHDSGDPVANAQQARAALVTWWGHRSEAERQELINRMAVQEARAARVQQAVFDAAKPGATPAAKSTAARFEGQRDLERRWEEAVDRTSTKTD